MSRIHPSSLYILTSFSRIRSPTPISLRLRALRAVFVSNAALVQPLC